MPAKTVMSGIAMRNFTRFPEIPDARALLDYGVWVEQLGFESLWVWDHILLGTGILVLPLRNPLLLAKQVATLDQLSGGRVILGMASGWYKREFDAVGVPFEQRGKIMDKNLEIITRLWTEPSVTAEMPPYNMRSAVMFPKPASKPRPPILIGGYVEAVLKRAGEKGDGWLTYFYKPDGFTAGWKKVCDYAKAAGKDPAKMQSSNQLPIMIGRSREEVKPKMMEWLSSEWDIASWSDSTPESAIIGTVDDCLAQLQEHVKAGVDRIIFVPWRYDRAQIEIIAREIVPKLGM